MCDRGKSILKNLLIYTFSEAEKLQNLGSTVEAFDLYTKFIDEASKYVSDEKECELRKKLSLSYNNRGFIRYNRVDFAEAVGDYTEAIKLDNSQYVTYYNRGLIHYRLGRYNEAITDMKKALEIKSDFSPAQSCLTQANIDKLSKEKKVDVKMSGLQIRTDK